MARPTFAQVFGEHVRRLRQERGISQEALAAEADLHRTHIGFIERGERVPSIEVALVIARAFGMSLTELVGVVEGEWVKRGEAPRRRKQ